MIVLPHSTTRLPAQAIETRPTRSSEAWDGMYLTVEIYNPIQVLRTHISRSGLSGDWFAIGDCVQTYSEYKSSRALPKPFRYVATCTLWPGTIANVGRSGPLFGQPGGGEQAEFLDGPLPTICPLDAIWTDQWGHA